MASLPITSWQIDGETMEIVRDFIFLGSKITADSDCSHEIKRSLLLGRKAMTNLDSILKSRDINTTLPTKGRYSQSYGFSSSYVWMWELDQRKPSTKELMLLNCTVGEDSWESLETARRSNQSILKEINSEYSLEGLMLWLKLQYFGQLMRRANSLKKDPDAGKDWRQEEKGMTENEMVGWHHWLKGHEFEQAPGDGDGQGSLECCSPWGGKEPDTTEQRKQQKLGNSKLLIALQANFTPGGNIILMLNREHALCSWERHYFYPSKLFPM